MSYLNYFWLTFEDEVERAVFFLRRAEDWTEDFSGDVTPPPVDEPPVDSPLPLDDEVAEVTSSSNPDDVMSSSSSSNWLLLNHKYL